VVHNLFPQILELRKVAVKSLLACNKISPSRMLKELETGFVLHAPISTLLSDRYAIDAGEIEIRQPQWFFKIKPSFRSFSLLVVQQQYVTVLGVLRSVTYCWLVLS